MHESLPIMIVGVCLGLGCVFFLSLSEASLVAVSRVRLRKLADEGDRRAEVVHNLVTSSDTYLTAIIVAITVFLMLVAHLVTRIVVIACPDAAQQRVWLPVASASVLAFILIFCELTPKSFAKHHPVSVALRVGRPVYWLTRALDWPVRGLTAVATAIIRALGGRVTRRHRPITPEDIQAAAEVGEREGTVDPAERQMIRRIIRFGEAAIREIMVPRVDIVALEASVGADDVLKTAEETGFSRIPVYDDTIDDIVGIVYVNDVLARFAEGQPNVTAREVAREAYHVPEAKKIDEVLRDMQRRQVHMAVVMDEYGGTLGLVTIEDILEEIVGEIRDEHDVEEPHYRSIGPGEYLVDAGVQVQEANERLGLTIPEGDYETIGGFVFDQEGRVPDRGERISLEGADLIVEDCDQQRINTVRIVKRSPTAETAVESN
ncbi:MAG: hemolysin family protein [Armatimonadota bacterium]